MEQKLQLVGEEPMSRPKKAVKPSPSRCDAEEAPAPPPLPKLPPEQKLQRCAQIALDGALIYMKLRDMLEKYLFVSTGKNFAKSIFANQIILYLEAKNIALETPNKVITKFIADLETHTAYSPFEPIIQEILHDLDARDIIREMLKYFDHEHSLNKSSSALCHQLDRAEVIAMMKGIDVSEEEIVI